MYLSPPPDNSWRRWVLIYLHYTHIHVYGRRFYPKQLTLHFLGIKPRTFPWLATGATMVALQQKYTFPSNYKDRYSPTHTHSPPTNMCLVMRHTHCYILLHVEFDHIFWEGCKDDVILKWCHLSDIKRCCKRDRVTLEGVLLHVLHLHRLSLQMPEKKTLTTCVFFQHVENPHPQQWQITPVKG